MGNPRYVRPIQQQDSLDDGYIGIERRVYPAFAAQAADKLQGLFQDAGHLFDGILDVCLLARALSFFQ